jgi:hypothetical protein
MLRRFGVTVRVFKCNWCGHSLRLGSRTCGSCFRPTPFYNRRAFYLLLAGALAVVMALLMLRGTTPS